MDDKHPNFSRVQNQNPNPAVWQVIVLESGTLPAKLGRNMKMG